MRFLSGHMDNISASVQTRLMCATHICHRFYNNYQM